MTCLTPRLFGFCKHDKHGECAKKLAMYRCSCVGHVGSIENEVSAVSAMPASATRRQVSSGACSLASLPYSRDSGSSDSRR